MRHIFAVFKKQFKDTVKNPALLIQFVLFPTMVFVMNNVVDFEEMPENFFTEMFSVMYIGMSPLIVMTGIVSEEKEKGTLRTLLMSGVHPLEYLSGTGLFVFVTCMLGCLAIVAQAGYSFVHGLEFMLCMAGGCIISEILGASIGIARPSQVSATGVAVPVTCVFSFLPMLSTFNETIEKAADFTYTYRINNLISDMACDTIETDNIWVILFSALAAILLFTLLYRKRGLE